MTKDEKYEVAIEILLEFQSETGIFPPASYVTQVMYDVGLERCPYCNGPIEVCDYCQKEVNTEAKDKLVKGARMKTAQEMRKLTETSSQVVKKEELRKVMDTIQGFAEMGVNEYTKNNVPIHIANYIGRNLEDLGYDVEVSNGPIGQTIKVSW